LAASFFRETNLDISAKFCPVCKKKNEYEAAICVHCGASLETFSKDSATTKGTDLQINGTDNVGEWVFDEGLIPVDGIAFYVEAHPDPFFQAPAGNLSLVAGSGKHRVNCSIFQNWAVISWGYPGVM